MKKAMERARRAAKAYARGDCLTAGQLIDQVYVMIGELKGRGKRGEAKKVAAALKKVDDKFEAHCVLWRPAR